MASFDLLEEGLMWRIGDGRSVNILGDKWLPKPSSYQIQSPCHGLNRDAKVSLLIDAASNIWNSSVVRDLFNVDEAEIICSLPISRYKQEDRLYWRTTSTGEFSVKSAYHLEMERKVRAKGEGSIPRSNSLWKAIWQLKISNSTKSFLWRACSNIFPTKVNLAKRRVLDNDSCILCQSEPETTGHALWSCPAAQDVWGCCNIRIQKSLTMDMDFESIVEMLLERCSLEDVELCAVVARSIWTRRNAVVHGEEFTHPRTIVSKAIESQNQFRSLQEDNRGENEGSGQVVKEKWKPPLTAKFKTNWDIAFDANHERMGLGVVIRDDKGRVMAALSRTMDSTQEPTVGEAMGALEAAEFSRDNGFFDIILEGDSKLVIEAITYTGSLWCKYGHIVGDIKEVLKAFRTWETQHVRRSANEAAHVLAKAATKENCDSIWLEDTPNSILDVVTLEQPALSV